MLQMNVTLVIIGIFGMKFLSMSHLWNGFHKLVQKAMNFNDITIFSIKGSDYKIRFWYMSKDDAISIMKNSDLKKRISNFFSLYIKISEGTYYQRNIKIILNSGKESYKNNHQWLKEEARNDYRELSDKEKNIKREYGRNSYHNISKEKNKD